ncbi:vascular protein [Trifolium pratense]|uniref:Vascular protein n=1 Tax=Trifolium pratense TaxID=57577 RepID=A0A2K3NLG4_TRIPR|nr:vascular protein [Trifolium pratense]
MHAEFDALTGSKISALDIGAPVVRMAYSPTSGHTVVAVLQDCTLRSCDFDLEQTCVLHSPEKKSEKIYSDTEVHLAMTPLQHIVFFGFHKRMSVTGGRAPTKIKTDLKKPIVNLACHPRLPVLYVAYADGLIRAYNIHTYAVHYTLQLENTIKLSGAAAFAFHPTLEWIFVGDRRGTLLAWDVSIEKPSMIGIIQVSAQPITSVAWLTTSRILVTLSKDGNMKVWKTRVIVNPHRPPMPANFFEPAAIEPIDIPRILSEQGGEAVYPLPRIKTIEIHPKSNLAALVFANVATGDTSKNKTENNRERRKQLFAVLQGARGSSASVLKEKLSALGSSGILADHQLQAQLQEHHMKGHSHLTISDIARKAFLHSHFMEGHTKSAPISRLPLIAVLDTKHRMKDIPVVQPFHLELNFFNKENRVLHYPVRAFYVDGPNLMAYNLSSGLESTYKKLYNSVPGHVEYQANYLTYSKKQHLFLVAYEFSGMTSEVVLYRENTAVETVNSKSSTIKGRDAAFIGPNENQFAILDDDKTGLALYILPGGPSQELKNIEKAFEENQPTETSDDSIKGPTPFMFETEVDRIFSTPLGMGFIVIIDNEVHWQETLRGHVAGILTTQRVLIVSATLDILAGTSTNFDKGLPPISLDVFKSLLWVGPALLFSTATAISILGWDGKVRSILSISMPQAVLVGALNDRLLLASPTEINPKQKKGVEIKSCLVGFLEPLLIGFVTMQQTFKQKLELSEILYQLTSRFDSMRVTPRSLDILALGSPVCGDLAVSLSQSGPQFTQMSFCVQETIHDALLRLNYFTGSDSWAIHVSELMLLMSVRSPTLARDMAIDSLYKGSANLNSQASFEFGQFDKAKETFEVTADYESMLDLFICHLNPSAMRRLAQKLEEEDLDSELRRHCERILRIRSTGWTQGIFANFAAESMVPKGPEWGGGNWEIKTLATAKDIPKWELAAEVTPYMRTDDAAIPSIVVDQIGVYLGSIKGRGNVVEVKEDSLVKAFTIAASDVKPNAFEVSPVKSIPNRLEGNDKTHGDSLMGLENLNKQLASSSADKQAKAAEEFKKSMYGAADDSSSDEEGVSKTKKIHIRIREKPIDSSVDVNKIKEAASKFKLAEGLTPSRSRSLTSGSQDLGQILAMPPVTTGMAAHTVPTPGDLFGTEAFTRSAPISQPTFGAPASGAVGRGPIPEDFFQNTVSSLQVAASLRPAGSYLSKLTPGVESSNTTANQFSPDVPPRTDQQPVVSNEPIGLPDGGLPPQSLGQAEGMPPSQMLAPISTQSQPLDLSVLGVPNSADKPAQAGSSPSSVRPGQVPQGAAASVCFKTGLAHLEQNHLSDALSCLDEAFLALAMEQSRGSDIKAQATICAQYKIAVTLLLEIGRLQKVHGARAISAKDEMARLSRHLGSLPLLAKHRINCIRTAIKRNMEVQNYAYSKQMLELLSSKAPPSKQEEFRSLMDLCVQRGLTNKSIDPQEDPSQFCAATLSRLSTIGYDVCDLCGSKFSAVNAPGCIICGMGGIKRSDALAGSVGPVPSPFG